MNSFSRILIHTEFLILHTENSILNLARSTEIRLYFLIDLGLNKSDNGEYNVISVDFVSNTQTNIYSIEL